MLSAFEAITRRVAALTGNRWAFIAAVGVVLVWAALGPFFEWSDSWQLAINTGTTIITFLMVFLIQAAQNHDARAVQLKLDELILSVADARNELAGIEREDDRRIDELDRRDR